MTGWSGWIMSFKSGVQHNPLAISDKETAQAMFATLKKESGLFKMDDGKGYTRPVLHDYSRKVPNGLTRVYTGLADKLLTTALFTDSDGKKKRMFLAECSCAMKKRQLIVEVV